MVVAIIIIIIIVILSNLTHCRNLILPYRHPRFLQLLYCRPHVTATSTKHHPIFLPNIRCESVSTGDYCAGHRMSIRRQATVVSRSE